MDAPNDVAAHLDKRDAGNEQVVGDLTALLYPELRRLASLHLRRERREHTLQTTALVHEAYLRLNDQREVHWKNREQFLGVAAQLMRRILVDYSRGHDAQKRGGGVEKVFLEEAVGIEVLSGLIDQIEQDLALTGQPHAVARRGDSWNRTGHSCF